MKVIFAHFKKNQLFTIEWLMLLTHLFMKMPGESPGIIAKKLIFSKKIREKKLGLRSNNLRYRYEIKWTVISEISCIFRYPKLTYFVKKKFFYLPFLIFFYS